MTTPKEKAMEALDEKNHFITSRPSSHLESEKWGHYDTECNFEDGKEFITKESAEQAIDIALEEQRKEDQKVIDGYQRTLDKETENWQWLEDQIDGQFSFLFQDEYKANIKELIREAKTR